MKTLLALLFAVSVCTGQIINIVKGDTSVVPSAFEIIDSSPYWQPKGFNMGIDDESFGVYFSTIYTSGNVRDLMFCSLEKDSLWFSDELKLYIAIGIQLWDTYAKECYADSSIISYGNYFTPKNVGVQDSTGIFLNGQFIGNHMIVLKPTYWHLKKPTLEGFVEFLRRKTNAPR